MGTDPAKCCKKGLWVLSGVVVGVVCCKVKKGANKALGRDERFGSRHRRDVVDRKSVV